MDAKELKEKVVECMDRAVKTGEMQYLYYFEEMGLEITPMYMGRDYLFCAYPGGRKVMSEECARVLNS